MSHEAEVLAKVAEAWGWRGLLPEAIVGENEFANFLVRDRSGQYWRICPEDISCEVVAMDGASFDQLLQDSEFQVDWGMEILAEAARAKFGALSSGRRFCLAIPAVLGGMYSIDNVRHAPLLEIIGTSGDLGQQIKDLPDGTQFQLKVLP